MRTQNWTKGRRQCEYGGLVFNILGVGEEHA